MLKSPDFGNTIRFVPRAIVHRSVGGTLLAGRNPNWTKVEGFTATFSALNATKLNEFLTWAIANAGLEVTFTDFQNQEWLGVIASRELEISKGRGQCDYKVSFTFEGRRVS